MPRINVPIIDRLEALLKTPMPQSVDEADWHEHATEIFISDQSDLPSKILDSSQEVVASLPLDEIENILNSPQLSPETIKKIKHTRRIAMIGRDSLCLAAIPPLPAAIDPYILLTKNFGLIADTRGQNQQVISDTLEIVRNTDRQAIHSNDLKARTPEELRQECARRYDIPTLLYRHSNQSGIEFHGARVGLRRVVHLGMMACAVEETPDRLQYLASGLRLNKIHGSFHEQQLRDSGIEVPLED